MKTKAYSLTYDLFIILFVNVIFFNFVNLNLLFKISIFNFSLILFLLIIKFYSRSSVLKIFDKLAILVISTVILSFVKLFFFNFKTYLDIIIFQDLLIIFMLVLPRVLLNIKEFKINFIKNYNQSRQGTLIIGGLGYIGSGVVRELLEKVIKFQF